MDFAYVIPQLLVAAPGVITLVVGIALIAARRERLAARARGLGVAGCAVLLVGNVTNAAYTAALPLLLRDRTVRDLSVLMGGVGLLFVLLNCVGLALLIAALLNAGTPRPAPWPGTHTGTV